MAAGLELFGTVGYRATTVRMLCKQAGLIDRYFYKNFTDTEDLLAAVYTESVDRIEAEVGEAIGPALASRDPGRRVRPERLLQGRRGLSSRSRVLAGNSRREPAGR